MQVEPFLKNSKMSVYVKVVYEDNETLQKSVTREKLDMRAKKDAFHLYTGKIAST